MTHDVKEKPAKSFIYFPMIGGPVPGLMAIPIEELDIRGAIYLDGDIFAVSTNRGKFKVVNGVATTYLGD